MVPSPYRFRLLVNRLPIFNAIGKPKESGNFWKQASRQVGNRQIEKKAGAVVAVFATTFSDGVVANTATTAPDVFLVFADN